MTIVIQTIQLICVGVAVYATISMIRTSSKLKNVLKKGEDMNNELKKHIDTFDPFVQLVSHAVYLDCKRDGHHASQISRDKMTYHLRVDKVGYRWHMELMMETSTGVPTNYDDMFFETLWSVKEKVEYIASTINFSKDGLLTQEQLDRVRA